MQIKTFTIPILDGEHVEEEMNRFLRSRKVMDIESHLVSDKGGSYWVFCVRYLDRQGYQGQEENAKTDYRKVLDEATFKKFSLLREIRKEIAQEDAVPAFAVLTDEELAGVAKLPEITVQSMQSIKGIGEKKMAKYGEKIVLLLQKKQPNEENRQSDTKNSHA